MSPYAHLIKIGVRMETFRCPQHTFVFTVNSGADDCKFLKSNFRSISLHAPSKIEPQMYGCMVDMNGHGLYRSIKFIF